LRHLVALIFLLYSGAVTADVVVALKTIRANTILTEDLLGLRKGEVGGTLQSKSDAIGQESRVVLYAGRPIRFEDIGPPALVTRNQLVPLHYNVRGLSISTTGRALDRGAAGETIRVMNLSSRSTLFGLVQENGQVVVE